MNKRSREYYIASMDFAFFFYDLKGFLFNLRNMIDANGGISALAKETGLNRENLYRMLSAKGNPTIKSLMLIFRSLKLQLEVRDGTDKEIYEDFANMICDGFSDRKIIPCDGDDIDLNEICKKLKR